MDLSKLTDEELITYRDKGLKSLSDDAIMRSKAKALERFYKVRHLVSQMKSKQE
jgi:hypothetical protein